MQTLLQEVKVDCHGLKGLYLTINRAEKANALTSELLSEIETAFKGATNESSIRYVVLAGAGKHLCAGADLDWMRASAQLNREENLKEAKRLSAMFSAIAQCPLPTIVLAKGRVYGGAVGLVAACDIVLASKETIFSLSEARLGIIPAVITPYILDRVSVGKLRELAVTTREVGTAEALTIGLVDAIGEHEVLVKDKIACLKKAGPKAVERMKALLRSDLSQSTCETAIADARASAEGKAGLSAFFAKTPPEWTV